MANLIHRALAIKVDLVVRKTSAYRLEEFRRRRRVMIEETPIWIVTPEDLILSKLVWMQGNESEVQRRDVQNLLTSLASLDRAYLEQWADALGALDRWRSFAHE